MTDTAPSFVALPGLIQDELQAIAALQSLVFSADPRLACDPWFRIQFGNILLQAKKSDEALSFQAILNEIVSY